MEERTHEVVDMENALKERQGELQQRANLVQPEHTFYCTVWALKQKIWISLSCIFLLSPPPLINPPQLAQLEMAIREHKQEMVRKVESLQHSLEARERELREVQQELTDKKIKVRRGRRLTHFIACQSDAYQHSVY